MKNYKAELKEQSVCLRAAFGADKAGFKDLLDKLSE